MKFYFYSDKKGGNAVETDMKSTLVAETLSPHPTEAIVLRFSTADIGVEELEKVFNRIKSEFPHNKVLAIPDYTSLRSCSKDVLENIISMVSEVIESL